MIKNLINNKCYIGFHATNKDYKYDTYYGSGNLIKSAIKKYGAENFIKGILEFIEPNEWIEKEQYWIKLMKSHVSEGGYNLTYGGDGLLGFKHSEKTIEKLRNKIITDETKINMSVNHADISGEKNPNYKGKITKQEKVREKIKNSKLGIPVHSEETKKKMSDMRKGKHVHSEEFKQKISANNKKYKTGVKASKETREKMSKTRRGVKKSEEHKRKIIDSRKKYFEKKKSEKSDKLVSESLTDFM